MSATAKIVDLHEASAEAGPQPAAIEGHIDAVQDGRLFGWAWDRNHPGDRLTVELRLERDGGPPLSLTRVAADRPRPDLAGGGIGDGAHAFEAELALPEGADPVRVVAVVGSPSTGETTIFAQPSPEDQRLDRLLGQHLQRLSERIDALRRDQRQLAAGQQALGRLTREAGEGVAALRADAGRAETAQGEHHDAVVDAVAGPLRELSERIGGLEVFLMRMDQSLRTLDRLLADKSGSPGWPPVVAVLASAGAFLAAMAGMLLFR
ncbi:hypothetical protein [Azospirillum picis]|uniref:Uncharacterized protein n=1 Tax=Azospirillum picis TaxID=488438 RepID=A0ABU0MHF0_9PROT|nr:hypothetical protein [Azospirillum picis]MBP2299000.1 hypothetical protein [Azospirillum picis]MDQ0532758.1 hypothetical protein [Azospirillum picis]